MACRDDPAGGMVIRKEERLASVLARSPSTLEVLATLAPVFEGLRDPTSRRVMTRLVTVEQAAQIAEIEVTDLIKRLDAVSHNIPTEDCRMHSQTSVPNPATSGGPETLTAIPMDRVVTIDVRDELRAGREPFGAIMAARARMPGDGALVVWTTFEPIPLYAAMARQGLHHHAEPIGGDEWRIWFFSVPSPVPGAPAVSTHEGQRHAPVAGGAEIVTLDVRNLEPPEPMHRTLAALESLPPGGTLVQLNVRVPRLLFSHLEERGFRYEIEEESPDLVRVIIHHR